MKSVGFLLLPLCILFAPQVQGYAAGQSVSSPMAAQDAQYECELILDCDSTSNPYSPIICTVQARIWNIGSIPGRIMSAEISLDPGLFLSAGSPVTRIPPGGWPLQPGDTTPPVSWNVRAIARETPVTVGISVWFTDSLGNWTVCRDSIYNSPSRSRCA